MKIYDPINSLSKKDWKMGIFNTFRIFLLLLLTGALFFVTAPVSAASGGYSSFIPAPQINQTNLIRQSQNWPIVGSSPPLTSRVTFISWNIGYTRPSRGSILVRICRPSPMRCTAWGGVSGSTALFNNENAVTPFFFQSAVSFGSNVVLIPAVQPSGLSAINVNYEF